MYKNHKISEEKNISRVIMNSMYPTHSLVIQGTDDSLGLINRKAKA
jgi:hypothetical protein